MTVKVRFAPSPTGYLHVGNCRTALINWLFAQQQKGTFLLRLDDTDQERSDKKYEKAIFEDFNWLGITYDEIDRQSTRLHLYEGATSRLKKIGRLYPCYETPEELAFKRRQQLGQGHPPIYDRAALALTDMEKESFERKGRLPHWRFKLEDRPIAWEDLVRGPVHFEGEKLSDPVLVRADGRPLYTLASVVDDIDLGVTHIIRGEDHVANTAVQIQLMQALGADPQKFHFAHLPLLAGESGEGLSKREGSLSVRSLQQEGILPLALIDLLGRLGTSLPIEAFSSNKPLIDGFSFSNFSRATPKFTFEELRALNTKLLHTLSYNEIWPYLTSWPQVTRSLWDNVQANLETLDDLEDWVRMYEVNPTPTCLPADISLLQMALETLPAQGWDDTDIWGFWLSALKKRTPHKGRALFMPLRQALTGQDHGPELSKIVRLLGYDKIKARLEKALQQIT